MIDAVFVFIYFITQHGVQARVYLVNQIQHLNKQEYTVIFLFHRRKSYRFTERYSQYWLWQNLHLQVNYPFKL